MPRTKRAVSTKKTSTATKKIKVSASKAKSVSKSQSAIQDKTTTSNAYTSDTKSQKITKSNNSLTQKALDKIKSAGKKAQKAPSPKSSPIKKADKTGDDDDGMVTAKFTGGAPVDQYFNGGSGWTVYSQLNNIYAKTLNLSDVGGNNNKFYILQVLNNGDKYAAFFRWGRTGTPGKTSTKNFKNASQAIATFNKKLNDKKYKSGYTELDIVYEDELSPEEYQKKLDQAMKDCELEVEVGELINLIFDTKLINKCMTEIGYDSKKMPLGKLSIKSIDEAYGILNNLMDAIKSKKNVYSIQNYSSQFYTLIPHNFGFQSMSNFVIDTEKKVQDKLDFLDTLKNMKITKNMSEVDENVGNIIEENYKKLKCEINPIKKKSNTWEVIDDYLQTSNPKGHRIYEIELENAYELKREGEDERFDKYCKDIGNRKLLWHGSRVTNFVGIISEGLRIAPPSAPISGYLFGKGVYFADMIAKSADYCRAETSDMTALILLCEVACGNPNKKEYFDCYSGNLPKGKHCTLGMGRNHPDPKNEVILDGVSVPMGPPYVGVDGEKRGIGYNEWVVYTVDQIKMKYLLKCKFKGRKW